jgi:shikimate dehydrogenase
MKKIYRLIGSKIENSPTARMMNVAFSSCRIDAFYEKCEATSLKEAIEKINEKNVFGCNITMPFKIQVASIVEKKDDAVRTCGALNTVVKEQGKLKGFNTDVDGIISSLIEAGVKSVKKVCAMGSGGATRAFLYACSKLGCEDASVLSRDKESVRGSFPLSTYKNMKISLLSYSETDGHFDLVFNGTPVGSLGIPTPKELQRIVHRCDTFFDAVYLPVETELIREARKNGLNVIYGHRMLLYQAKKAFTIFTGREPPLAIMERELEESLGLV